jgi:meso-butanediol dehydrogenase/(S,S)-butanediol dehydrogenase/diacetyl reductase
MSSVLSGKTVVITGASRGIGRQFAQTLSAEGASIILLARASAELDSARAACGENALAIPCDIGDPQAVRHAFAKIAGHFAKIDTLINNAAICMPYQVATARDEDVIAEVSINLIGPILCVREAIPLLKASSAGDIVNISSEAVRLPFPYLTVYTATKGGLETFSAGLRTELRPFGIRVTTMRLGNVIETSIKREWSEATSVALADASQLSGHAAFTGKGGSVETVSRAMVNLLSLPRDFNVDLIELRSL